MGELILHGRDDDRVAVVSAPDGLTLIAGDSGIGKSSFLSSLTTWPGEPLVSRPIVLKSLEGSLQTAIADAITDCISQYLSEAPDVQKAWVLMKSIADRAKTITGREIGHAVLARALTFAESKLGEEAVAIGKKVLGDVATGGLLGFKDQLASIRVPDRAKELCNIASEFGQAVGRPIVLRLDNAERLLPSDQGLVAELVDAVVGPVRVVVCVTSHHASGDAIIHQVSLRGSKPRTLRPLSRPAIEEWLVIARVAQPRWDTISRLSSGYPFFIEDAIRLAGDGASLDNIAAPNGFEALMRASWTTIPEGIRAAASRLAPFIEPPSDDFILMYLGFDILEWGILADTLLESGIFVRRSDGTAWFHDRRRAFIWDHVLGEKQRKHVASKAFVSVASWVDGRSDFELWVPPATAVLARAAEPSAIGSFTNVLITMPDEQIALLWGLIEVIESGSITAPFVEIREVLHQAEARSGLAIDALATMSALETKMLIVTIEAGGARLVRSNVRENTQYAALLGEIQLRFQATPRPHMATAAFNAFIRPVMGSFNEAVVALGRFGLLDQKTNAKLLSKPTAVEYTSAPIALGATVVIDDQHLSFTASFSSREARDEAKRAILAINKLTSRVRLDRALTLPQPPQRYTRYRLAAESLGFTPAETSAPTLNELIEHFDMRARYSDALGAVSAPDETEVLNLGPRRFLVDMRGTHGSWASIEVRTDEVQPTRNISELALDLRDPLLELHLRSAGYLTGRERIVRTVTQMGSKPSIPHPLTAVLDDIDAAGRKYNSGLRSLVFTPDASVLERGMAHERELFRSAANALESLSIGGTEGLRRSLLIGFWEDNEAGWVSDFGAWSAFALLVEDDKSAVIVRKLSRSPFDDKTWKSINVPDAFEDHVGATVISVEEGDLSSIIAPLLGYQAEDARMVDLSSPLGQMIQTSHDVLGESDHSP